MQNYRIIIHGIMLFLQYDGGSFAILGKSLATPRVEVIGAQNDISSPLSSHRPSTSNSLDDPGEPLGSLKLPPDALGVLETVISMNKTLEHQVETLRLRIDVEEKQHQKEKQKLLSEKETELQQREKEIDNLRESVFNREDRIDVLLSEKEEQETEISEKMGEIDDLRELVMQTEGHTDKLSKKITKLKSEKRLLESDAVYKQQNDEIRKLKNELAQVKDKLNAMETELVRAKNVIEQQNKKIKSIEFEKNDMNNRFKIELEKASKAMRLEVERMREVMKQQYEEMKGLREQNQEISSDVRDIKELLLNRASEPPQTHRSQTREVISINHNFLSNNGTRYGRTATPGTRASLPNMKAGHTPNPSRGLPPIAREGTKDNKWVPSGSPRKSMNALSAKGARRT